LKKKDNRSYTRCISQNEGVGKKGKGLENEVGAYCAKLRKKEGKSEKEEGGWGGSKRAC